MNSIEQEEWAFARAVADSDAVLRVYAAPEFDEMSDDGKEWIRALVVEARRTAQAEIVSALERIDKMMRDLRAIKSRPIANSGFSTGPALHFDQARRIALDARREVRAALSKYRTDATKGADIGG